MPENFEYFEGTRTIQHEDGSTTYVNYIHEPHVEPLTPKQNALLIGVATLATGAVIGLPFMIERLEEWSHHRREVRHLKKDQELKDIKSANKND